MPKQKQLQHWCHFGIIYHRRGKWTISVFLPWEVDIFGPSCSQKQPYLSILRARLPDLDHFPHSFSHGKCAIFGSLYKPELHIIVPYSKLRNINQFGIFPMGDQLGDQPIWLKGYYMYEPVIRAHSASCTGGQKNHHFCKRFGLKFQQDHTTFFSKWSFLIVRTNKVLQSTL